MLEIVFTGLFVTVAVVVIGSKDRQVAWSSPDAVVPLNGQRGDDTTLADLPCPWCRAQTDEEDASCPNCGQRFG